MNTTNSIQIVVISVDGKPFSVDIDPEDTVENLKARIEQVAGTPVDE